MPKEHKHDCALFAIYRFAKIAALSWQAARTGKRRANVS
jgi:hypothetical protein